MIALFQDSCRVQGDPLEETERRTREPADYIDDAERLEVWPETSIPPRPAVS